VIYSRAKRHKTTVFYKRDEVENKPTLSLD